MHKYNQLKSKYARKIRELNNNDYQYRRRGAGNYANYNYNDDPETYTYRRDRYSRYHYDD